MTRDAFVSLFLDVVAKPACARGYRWVGKSQTLALDSGEVTVVLIRLGGRLARPGSIAHVLCARHRFFRSLLDEAVPPGDALSVDDYPYKLRLTECMVRSPEQWIYRPSNLGHWEYDRIEYGGSDQEAIEKELAAVRDCLLGPVSRWADGLSVERASAEIRKYGENAWCERLWLEDYQSHER